MTILERWSGAIKATLSILPTLIVVSLIEANHLETPWLPVPFLNLLVAVGVAGYFGGRLMGVLAGLVAAGLVFHGYLEGFGPRPMTGTLFQASMGMLLYVVVGFLVG
ncbi:MAG: hypothetical protein HKN18_04045 [Silicimonas sp.]|nr:hypothetical protein [Silicimonas sp.]